MSVIAVIQARMGSRRLPGKVLETLGNKPVLAWVVQAAVAVPGIDGVIVATGDTGKDDAIEQWCQGTGQAVFRGPSQDVLSRYCAIVASEKPEAVMRITADCPLLDPAVCGEVLDLFKHRDVDYAHNVWPRTWPDGLDCEVVRSSAIERADAEAVDPADREHVTSYIRNHPERFSAAFLPCPRPNLGAERWTLDTPEDLRFLRELVTAFPAGENPGYLAVLDLLNGVRAPFSDSLSLNKTDAT